MKLFAYTAVLILIFGCTDNKNSSCYKPTPESIEREKLADMIMAQVASKLRREKGLVPCGTGGGTSGGVRMLALSFDYRQPTTIESGRELLITSVQELINSINQDKRIRPHLKNYPFEAKNVEIRIFLQNGDGSHLMSGLHVISACNGTLRYKIANPDGPLFITLLEETYEEALQKLTTNSSSEIQTTNL